MRLKTVWGPLRLGWFEDATYDEYVHEKGDAG
jgi:hypothetical protein